MNGRVSNPKDLLRLAADHLQARRFDNAAATLNSLCGVGHATPQVLLMLAVAHQEMGNDPAAAAALDHLLELEPRAVRALVMRGQIAARSGKNRAAAAFYKRALGFAETQSGLPDDLQREVFRAREWVRAFEEAEVQRLDEQLSARGIDGENRSSRFQESLDIVSGRKRVFLQQPEVYYFPRLPQIQFFEPERFEWAAAMEQAAHDLCAELKPLLDEPELFSPYLVSKGEQPASGYHGLVDNPKWSSFYLWSRGAPVERAARQCPRTFEALDGVPLPRISVRAPVVMLSLLRPGARIPPHHGSTNVRLVCHLPLVVPEGCGIRVGNETREWEKGKLLIFDDSIEHEAWNDGPDNRLVLIFDVWRPELTEDERVAVQNLFEVIDNGTQS